MGEVEESKDTRMNSDWVGGIQKGFVMRRWHTEFVLSRRDEFVEFRGIHELVMCYDTEMIICWVRNVQMAHRLRGI